jgi:hypothetical protein
MACVRAQRQVTAKAIASLSPHSVFCKFRCDRQSRSNAFVDRSDKILSCDGILRLRFAAAQDQTPLASFSKAAHHLFHATACALREPRCLLLLAADLMRATFGGTPRPGMTEREHPMKLR